MMLQNELLVDIARQYSDRSRSIPDDEHWKELADRFKRSKTFENGNYNCVNISSYLAEIDLSLFLEDMNSQFGDLVQLNPLDHLVDGPQQGQFQFKRHLDSLNVLKDGKVYSNIDQCAVIDGLPTLFEIKLSKYHQGGRNYRYRRKTRPRVNKNRVNKNRVERHPSNKGTRYAMDPKRIKYLLAPLVQAFNTNELAYVLIVPLENISPRKEDQSRFEEQGGILLPFFMAKKSYRDYVAENIVPKHELQARSPINLRDLKRYFEYGRRMSR